MKRKNSHFVKIFFISIFVLLCSASSIFVLFEYLSREFKDNILKGQEAINVALSPYNMRLNSSNLVCPIKREFKQSCSGDFLLNGIHFKSLIELDYLNSDAMNVQARLSDFSSNLGTLANNTYLPSKIIYSINIRRLNAGKVQLIRGLRFESKSLEVNVEFDCILRGAALANKHVFYLAKALSLELKEHEYSPNSLIVKVKIKDALESKQVIKEFIAYSHLLLPTQQARQIEQSIKTGNLWMELRRDNPIHFYFMGESLLSPDIYQYLNKGYVLKVR